MRRLHEEASLLVCDNSVVSEPILMYEHLDGPILKGFCCAGQFQGVKTDKFTLSVSTGNNCVMLDGCIPAVVRNILLTNTGIVLICEKFVSVHDAFQCPMSSARFNIFKVSGRCRNMFSVLLSDVICKCVLWPLFDRDSLVAINEIFFILPLLH